jgi:DNA-binding PadR family transcriptional regulator
MSWWDEGGPRRRRMYDLTPQGRRELAAERKRWLGFARGVQAVMGVPS